MAVIHLQTFIAAPPQVVFDISRSVDVHQTSMQHHKEKAIDGVQSGLMNKGDTVTWQAKHLFKTRTLKVKITEMQPPSFFVDEIMEGDFKMMRHEHHFKSSANGTLMTDNFRFQSPFGFIGKFVDAVFLKAYMSRLLVRRNEEIKRIAEQS